MTKEELLNAIRKEADEHSYFYPDYSVIEALEQCGSDFELVAPILEIIGSHPAVDFGAPGELVHFVERFYNEGYEELLIESVQKNPTSHNIWMLHRCYNDPNDKNHEIYINVINDLKNDISISNELKQTIDEFTWE